MKRVLFVNRYFFPDHSATSQILSDLAFYLADRGHDVHVIASRQRYDDPQAKLPVTEAVHGVSIHRVSTTRFGRSSLPGRGVDYLSFYHAAWRAMAAVARPGDILVAKTDPPLLCIPAMHAARRRRVRLVNWLQDLYPEVAMRLGVPLVRGRVAEGLLRLRDAALRAAAVDVVVGEQMGEILRTRGIAPEQIEVIPNWCDDENIQPVSPHDNLLRRDWKLDDRFVVGYSGNLGRGHEFATLLGAAECLRSEPRIVFLFVGGGSGFVELARLVRARKLDAQFRFLPYQERAVLSASLSVPDVHWLSLKPELEGLIVPSKFYGIAAAGRPAIAVAAADGEIGRLVQRHDCGVVVKPGDAEGLAAVIRRLANDPLAAAEMGRRARAMLDTHFARRRAFDRWERLLERIG